MPRRAARLREKGATALHRSTIVAASAPTSVQRAARDWYVGWPDVAVVATRDNRPLLQSLLAGGANPNATTADGTPVLTAATFSGNLFGVELLLVAGAQAGEPDRRGHSALLAAAFGGRDDIAAAMLSHGASADGRPRSKPPIVAAAQNGGVAIVRRLLAARTSTRVTQRAKRPDRGGAGGRGAAAGGPAAGAAPEGVDKAGRTALWCAARNGRTEAMRTLLQHGASADHPQQRRDCFAAACSARAMPALNCC
jgi:ankyrin repeat protein